MGNLILHQTPLEDIKEFIFEAVAEQFKKCQVNKPNEPERKCTRKETAAQLGISLPTLNDYTKRGAILSCRIGGSVRYRQSDIDAALSNGEIKTKKK